MVNAYDDEWLVRLNGAESAFTLACTRWSRQVSGNGGVPPQPPPPPGSFSASVTTESWQKIDVSLRSFAVSPEPAPYAWYTPSESGAAVSRNEAASAVSASVYLPWYTATRARNARLNLTNVAGVSKPVNPVPSLKGNAVPPAFK